MMTGAEWLARTLAANDTKHVFFVDAVLRRTLIELGTLGVTRPAAFAAKRVILVAEEIRPRALVLSDPGLVLIPTLKVAAVVHEPFGAFPSPVQGHYGRYHDFYQRFHEESRTVEGYRGWLDHWVLGVRDWKGFLAQLDPDALERVRVRRPLLSEPLDYGA